GIVELGQALDVHGTGLCRDRFAGCGLARRLAMRENGDREKGCAGSSAPNRLIHDTTLLKWFGRPRARETPACDLNCKRCATGFATQVSRSSFKLPSGLTIKVSRGPMEGCRAVLQRPHSRARDDAR